ncbi:RNA polymerase-binding protein DksA [Pseudomonas sp. CC6-YY-74]|uniref:RNA polymerase-binding protein DksA n=1 Tax=Pseudomonas sp. CC6-YY-74 TaxID=1930532 RepID=UPI0009A1AEE7|nr:RNA polymerase-binding protein DksA [Pseudomonas sp. CC6-YY-74]
MTLTLLTATELLAQPADDYMNDAQQQFFRAVLLSQRGDLQTRIAEEFETLREHETSSDPADIGSAEELRQWQLRQLEREKQRLDKIDAALDHLARGEYGWCRETGEPIGLKRLLLRPAASLCIEAKERQEQREKHLRHAEP